MDFVSPSTWDEALRVKAEHPDAVAICGGTDVMVELNFDRRRPDVLLDLTRIDDLRTWSGDDERVRLGASVTYAQVIAELGERLPGLAMAARTVGSPQIRNRGTVGGNLGAASPAGDSHPPLLANDTTVVAESVRGAREIAIGDFYTGVKASSLADDELIRDIVITVPSGPQQFAKIGPRNAMVIAVAAFAITLHPDQQRIGTGLGSVGPTPLRAYDAERFLSDELDDRGLWSSREAIPDAVQVEFGRLVAAATNPISDVRGTADYRRHSVGVLARRTLRWAWNEYGDAI